MKIYKRMLDEALNQIELADRICNLDELSTSEIFVLIKVVVGCDTDYFTCVEIPMPRRTFYSVIQTLIEKGFVEKQGHGYSLNLDMLYDKTHIQLPSVIAVKKNEQLQNIQQLQNEQKVEITEKQDVEVEKTEKRTNFVPPTIEEVEQAFFEKTKDRTFSHETAVKWWNFYNSKGWFVGKNKMKSWKSAIVTWLKTDQIAVSQPIETRDFDDNGNFIGF